MHYYYDEFNRLSRLDNGNYYTYRYTYDKKGNLISLLDEFCNITTTYGYDSIGRLVSSNRSNGFGMYQTYDAFNRISKLVYSMGDDTNVYRYNYNDKNLIGSVVLPTGKSISNSYDSLNRLVSKQIGHAAGLSVSYTYKAGINGTTSALVETVTTAEGIFSYTYDQNGNILTVTKNGVLQESYTYDELGQLKTVTRGTNVYEYTYDNGGNILSVKLNGTVTDTYTYGDSTWGDMLTSYNGQTVTYDELGNITFLRDMCFSWTDGRRLREIMSDDGLAYSTFTYNADGLRVKNSFFDIEECIGTDYYYEYNGNLLVRQSWNNNVMWFLYDESGSPVGFILNDTEYYYIKNLQGDITAITDANGTILAKYTYDVWGKILSITDGNGNDVSANKDHIANINPIRYRGYYYDSEMGVYYVSSRYYDPEIGRFINADDIDYLGADGSPLSYNLFAYCMNNPVNRFDVNGNWSLPNWAKVAIGAVAIAGLAVATVCTGGAAGVIAGAALTGAISGGISGAVSGAVSGAIENGWQGALDGACTGFMTGTLIGGATGAATSGLSMATGAVKVVGSAQKTGTILHKAASNIEAGKMALNPVKYSKITLNRALNTAGLSGRRMPDVIGIARNGSSKLIEVVSKSQTVKQMTSKCISMVNANPGASYKVVGWAATISRLFS